MTPFLHTLSEKTALSIQTIETILSLLEAGATIPFIARYRKEATNGASDIALRAFEELYMYTKKLQERKEEITRLIKERSTLTPQLSQAISQAQTLQGLEDIFRPFKEKKNSRATHATHAGLLPLARILSQASLTQKALLEQAKGFVCTSFPTAQTALQGAQDILAEHYSDNPKERAYWRDQLLRFGLFQIKGTKTLDPKGLYAKLAQSTHNPLRIPSHRYLALMRGVREKELHVKLDYPLDKVHQTLAHFHLPKHPKGDVSYLLEAYMDGFKRLLFPSLEREIHSHIKEKADHQAIATFGNNLTQLLNTPPVTKKVILGVDPAYRTGCKLAVIDQHGTYLDHAIIYPTPPQQQTQEAKKTLSHLIDRYGIEAVAIGNGTATRETQHFFALFNQETGANLAYTVVSEAGASVYSASSIASEEYPDLDVSIRGAISIAQRLRDPMAALVKIDPKALGIGQYQHDVDQKKLEKKLHEVTEDLVNRIGVDPNSASASLLAFVAGIGPKLAQAIIAHRQTYGPFTCKQDLLSVKGLGAKAYQQCAGFFRIREGKSLLDNTGVHPENYPLAQELLGLPNLQDSHTTTALAAKYNVGEATLQDILFELQRPGFDPRQTLPPIIFRSDVCTLDALKEGEYVAGVVRNIVDFGVFVDIGLKNDGFIHISELSTKRIVHPLEVLSLNQHISTLRVLAIDKEKEKVSLSLKEPRD